MPDKDVRVDVSLNEEDPKQAEGEEAGNMTPEEAEGTELHTPTEKDSSAGGMSGGGHSGGTTGD